jgi:TorA maturation chaperone TorD
VKQLLDRADAIKEARDRADAEELKRVAGELKQHGRLEQTTKSSKEKFTEPFIEQTRKDAPPYKVIEYVSSLDMVT